MDIDWVSVVSRWMHILAAITAVGGTIFARYALVPAAGELPEADRVQLMTGVRTRWFKFVNAAILFLLVSGLYNIVMIMKYYKVPVAYHILFTVKLLLALAIFFLASVLHGRSGLAQRVRQKLKFWLNVNVTMAVVLVMISGVMRALPHPPKPVAQTTTEAIP